MTNIELTNDTLNPYSEIILSKILEIDASNFYNKKVPIIIATGEFEKVYLKSAINQTKKFIEDKQINNFIDILNNFISKQDIKENYFCLDKNKENIISLVIKTKENYNLQSEIDFLLKNFSFKRQNLKFYSIKIVS